MTDQTSPPPEPERPFDPDAAERVSAYLAAYEDECALRGRVPARGYLSAMNTQNHGSQGLAAADLYEVVRQLAYRKQEGAQLAEKCHRLHGERDDALAKLATVRAVTTEWHTYAMGEGRAIDPNQVAIAGHVLAQVLHALDGDPDGSDE